MHRSSVAVRIRQSLFRDGPTAGLSLLLIGLVLWAAVEFWLWGVWHSTTVPSVDACRAARGACWGVVAEKHRLVFLGRFPQDQQWRPVAAMLLLLGCVGAACLPRFFNLKGAALVSVALGGFAVLMHGGITGLPKVTTDLWGGLPLTLALTIGACGAAVPLAILLALGRRSQFLVIQGLSAGFIEAVRGVPLITLLFFGAFALPLLFPPEWRIDPMIRIALCLTAFRAAYLAEIFRGGLQAVPKGQYEAARALGLGPLRTLRHIVLPQALRVSIAPATTSFLGALKDTSLVAVVNIYDMTGSLKLAMSDAQWKPFFVEMYIAVAAVYLLLGLLIIWYGRYLERRYSV